MLTGEYEYLKEKYDSKSLDKIGFLDGATNVYRTKDFIVKQAVGFCSDGGIHPVKSVSCDTYYYRTPLLDRLYDKLFDHEGKRIQSAMYTRTYIY